MILGGGGIEGDGAADVIQGCFALAHLAGENAEKMQGVCAVRFGIEYLAVDPLGLAQASGLVVLDGEVERFLKIHGFWSGFFHGDAVSLCRPSYRLCVVRTILATCGCKRIRHRGRNDGHP